MPVSLAVRTQMTTCLRQSLMCLTVLLAGCAAGPMKPLVFPEPIGLQDPLPGMAVAYFLRIPNDYGEVTLSMGGEVVGTLPPLTYTAIQLKPGRYVLTTAMVPKFGTSEPGEDFRLEFQALQRRYFYVSKPRISRDALSLAFIAGRMVPIIGAKSSAIGPWHWTEASESDAQGLMSNSKPKLAQRDVL